MIDKVLPGQPLKPSQPVTPRTPRSVPETERAGTGQGVAFRQLLDESLRTAGGVKFSAHAVRRLESRGIELAPHDVQAVELALNRAAEKGARDSLVLADRYALVINVPSRTVITAFDQEGLQENVVTNIDSAVFVT